ncbi:MAG: outer membrane protein assembly factor BamB [Halioglobus sp.]|jgi:outer membrane protein assembly factor BamB|nr:outer membrane protein assembly factor BamB [Halioglobus sp.]
MRQISRYLLLLTMMFSIAGCSTVSGWFDSDDDDPMAPMALSDITETVKVKELWSVGVGDGQGDGFYRLQPAISGEVIYAASADGEVVAVDRNRGKTLWEVDLDLSLSGGVGVYKDVLLLGSSEGLVLKLDANTGEQLWTTMLTGEILSPPQANGKVVVAQTYNGKLQGLDFATGQLLWTYNSKVPVLTIRGTSVPIIENNRVYAGFANGRVLAFDAQTGSIVWEVRVAIPQGRSEIERIVDVDGTMELAGNELYAVSYQGSVVAIDVESGRKIWQQKASSFSGVSLGFGNVYAADEDGTLNAFMRNGEDVRWSQGALGYRQLSRPTPVGSYVTVGDFEGYLHVLSQVDGDFVGRVRVDSDGVRADMLSEDGILYVFANDGELVAYEITAKNE